MVYYGLTLNGAELTPGMSLHLQFLIGAGVEFVAYGLNILVCIFLGRRYPLSGMFFMGGTALFLMLFVDLGEFYFLYSNSQ